MSKKRKIAVVTGSRAEYGLLYWLMHEIREDCNLELQLIVTGMHLSPEFGLTYQQIEKDGFNINAKVEMLLSSDSSIGVSKSIGLGIIGFADALSTLNPDIMVVLGDRYEIFAACTAAMIARIPIAHLCGGESCESLIDEPIRHAITKMSHLHFVTAEPYRQRVIQMGEAPETVYNVGTPGLDHLLRSNLLDKSSLEQILDFNFAPQTFLITYHNVTLRKAGPEPAMRELFKALDLFPEAKIIFTKPNSDMEGRVISAMIEEYSADHYGRVKCYTSLGSINYLSAMQYSDVVIGNSSSGLVEAPCLKKPTVNVGERQKGRLQANSVINCNESAAEIAAAIKKALSVEFQDILNNIKSPYGLGNASVKIKDVIQSILLEGMIIKRFHDINPTSDWPRC